MIRDKAAINVTDISESIQKIDHRGVARTLRPCC